MACKTGYIMAVSATNANFVTGLLVACSNAATLPQNGKTATLTKVANCVDGASAHLENTAASANKNMTCTLCASGYMGATADKNGKAGSQACTAITGFTNCDVAAFGMGTAVNKCKICKTGYVLKLIDSTCVAHTTTSNCGGLATNNVDCEWCKLGYLWNLTKCEKSAYIAVVNMLGLALAALYM
jgi:hypothetical protein